MSKKPNINNLDLKASDLDVYTKGEIEEHYSTKNELQTLDNKVMSHLADIAHLVPVRTATNVADCIQSLYNSIDDYETLKIPSGTYDIDKPLLFDRPVHLDFKGVILRYTGSDATPAITVGKDGVTIENIVCVGLDVRKKDLTNKHSNPNEIGIRFVNLKYSKLEFSARGFYNLVVVDAVNGGNVYNDYRPNLLIDGFVTLTITSDVSGWSNENNFYGGSFTQYSTNKTPDKVHVKVVNNGYRQNNNRFFGCSFEDPSGLSYAIDCDGASHYFIGCRFEGSEKVKFGSTSLDNKILYGFRSDYLSIEDLGSYNDLISNRHSTKQVNDRGYNLKSAGASYKVLKVLSTIGDERFTVDGSGNVTTKASIHAATKYTLYDTTRGIFTSNGNPNSVVAASAGSLHLNRTGGFDGIHYKRTGISTTSDWETIQIIYAKGTRPTSPPKGFMMFDDTIGKPIWYNGTGWVDSTGIAVE